MLDVVQDGQLARLPWPYVSKMGCSFVFMTMIPIRYLQIQKPRLSACAEMTGL
jgi:hypothetical protein